MGVTKLPNGKFRARITLHGQRVSLGIHDRKKDAQEAIDRAIRLDGLEYEDQEPDLNRPIITPKKTLRMRFLDWVRKRNLI